MYYCGSTAYLTWQKKQTNNLEGRSIDIIQFTEQEENRMK